MNFSYFLAKGVDIPFEHLMGLLALEAERDGADKLPDGISSVQSSKQLLDIAIDRGRRFLAARKVTAVDGNLFSFELFHVVPEDGAPRLGLLLPEDTPPNSMSGSDLVNTVLAQVTHTEASRLPRYTELSTLLLSNGSVQLQSLSQQDEVAHLKSDLMHQSALLEDTERELKRQRDKYQALVALPSSSTRSLVAAVEKESFDDLDRVADWAKANEKEIVVLPRALQGVKKSIYFRPELVCKGLEVLAGAYRRMRVNEATADDFQKALEEHGFKLEGSVSPSIAGSLGETYFVKWQGRREFLDLHLLKGGGRDERYCLRIYFFWDAESSRVVVGDMPAHLPNSLS